MGQGQPGSQRIDDVCEINFSGQPLGRGSFGTVWRAKLKKDGSAAAVKGMDKHAMAQMQVPHEMIQAEVEFMRETTGPGKDWFVQMYDFIDSKDMYFIVMEFCDGGNLEDAAREMERRSMGETKVVSLMKQLLQGVAFLHSRSICHRDIKPQNTMLVGRVSDNRVKVKLGDFGIAARTEAGKLLTDKVGTPAFMAPEMHLLPHSPGYDCQADIWAVGSVMVFLLVHEYPFVDGSGQIVRDQILRGDLPLWDINAFSGLFQRVQSVTGLNRKRPSRLARELVRLFLNTNRQKRPCALDALDHMWCKPGADLSDWGDDMPLLDWKEHRKLDRDLKRVGAGIADATGRVAASVKYSSAKAASAAVYKLGEVADAVDIEVPLDALTEEQQRRRAVCHLCTVPSSSASHVCPLCSASVCFPCARTKLAAAPCCPNCGDKARNESALNEFIAAGEAWESMGKMATRASEVTEVLTSRTSFATVTLMASAAQASQATGKFATRAISGIAAELDKKDTGPSTYGTYGTDVFPDFSESPAKSVRLTPLAAAQQKDAERQAVRRQMSNHAQLQLNHSCHFCKADSSSLDIACPVCTTTVCLSCAPRHLSNDPCCPQCRNSEFCSPQILSWIVNATQVRDSVESLWQGFAGVGRQLFGGGNDMSSGLGARCTPQHGKMVPPVIVEEVVAIQGMVQSVEREVFNDV